jgi:hypothetical protein
LPIVGVCRGALPLLFRLENQAIRHFGFDIHPLSFQLIAAPVNESGGLRLFLCVTLCTFVLVKHVN